MPGKSGRDRQRIYTVGTLDKALTVLELLEGSSTPLNLQEISGRTRIQRLAVYRILSTLENRGYVRRQQDKRYLAATRRRPVLGYLAPLTGNSFRVLVADSLAAAAKQARVDLRVFDNPEDDEQATIGNARRLVAAGVDIVVFFEPVEVIGHAVADLLLSSRIPFITVEIGIESGVYYGANNYQAGKMAGQALGAFALQRWKGRFDYAVLIESSVSSQRVRARVGGALAGLREVVGEIHKRKLISYDGRARQADTYRATREFLREPTASDKLLISAVNDLSAIGALQALREMGLEENAAIVGQNGSQESWPELRNPRSRLIASVAYFPETYGQGIIDTALSVLADQQVPPAVYTEHALLTHENIDRYYPVAAKPGIREQGNVKPG
jgi:ribose transport system substrate-binding protein